MSWELQDQRVQRRQLLQMGSSVLAAAVLAGSLPELGHAASFEAAHDASSLQGTIRLRMETGPGKDMVHVVEAFKKEVPGINIEFTQIDPASAGSKWFWLALQSKLTDLQDTENSKFFFLDSFLKDGFLQPITKYVKQYHWDKVMVPGAIKHATRFGQVWQLTLMYELPGIVYRKSVFEKAGVSVPKTWNEFLTVLSKFRSMGLIPLTVGHRGFSQIMELHMMLWSSIGGTKSIERLVFGKDKWTGGAPAAAANAVVYLYKHGFLDKDALSITQNDAAERFLGGKAAMHVTGTWFYSEIQRDFGSDWDMFTAPGPGGRPVWCLGEVHSMAIPKASLNPDAAARFLDYCVAGNGAKILRQLGNLMATTKYSELAIPQVKHLPLVTGEPSALDLFGWLPQATQNAWQQGLGGILDGSVSVNAWLNQVQQTWEQDIASGNVPSYRSSIL